MPALKSPQTLLSDREILQYQNGSYTAIHTYFRICHRRAALVSRSAARCLPHTIPQTASNATGCCPSVYGVYQHGLSQTSDGLSGWVRLAKRKANPIALDSL